jgi:Zn-dependent protease with chaperone function
MATDFFQHQDVARRKTGLLVVLFILAVVAIVIAVNLVFAVVFTTAMEWNAQEQGMQAKRLDPMLFVWVSLGTIGVIAIGSIYKTSEIASGGETVALMLGGRLINQQTQNRAERRLLNVVEEMAIASGTAVPPVYVLDREKSINAFAAGHQSGDAVIGVSRGCLDYLTRDELQGVMAHEFSHMLNGDMRMNLRLIGILHGILVIALIGYFLLRSMFYTSGRSDKKGGAIPILLVAVGLMIIGWVGVLFGQLIKAAVSRQREYLADASAVQFTRYPGGIAGALKKIGGIPATSHIEDPHASEVSHMFFGDAMVGSFLNMFGTHPPLGERISRIDPSFDGKFPKIKRLTEKKPATKKAKPAKAAKKPGSPLDPLIKSGAGVAIDPAGVIGRIGVPGMEQLMVAAAIIESMPPPITEAAHEPYGARAIIYALLLDRDEAIRARQLEHLKKGAEKQSFTETRRLMPRIDQLPPDARAPLVEMAIPALKNISPAQYSAFLENVDALVNADEKIDLFEYSIRTLLVRNLDVHFGRGKPTKVRYHAFTPVFPSLVNVLSTLARVGHDTQEKAEHAFGAGLAAADRTASMSPKEECTLRNFDQALDKLAQASPGIKRRIMMACTACIAADEIVTVRESELLRVIAAVLECPLPPLPAPAASTETS